MGSGSSKYCDACKRNKVIKYCSECREDYCKNCSDDHLRLSATRDHRLVDYQEHLKVDNNTVKCRAQVAVENVDKTDINEDKDIKEYRCAQA